MASSRPLTDHDEIRKWAEARKGKPAAVKGTGAKGDIGMIRLDFPGYTGADKLEEISWDDFFEKFDAEKLAFLYQEESNFNKLVSREPATQSGTSRRR